MALILIIPVLCFLTSFIHTFTKKIFNSFTFETSEEKRLGAEIASQRAELRSISMREDYTNYVKLERKIVVLEEQLNKIRAENMIKKMIFKYGFQYGFNILCSLMLVFISIFYRKSPIFVFEENYNFSPFGSLMSFPSGVSNAVGVPFWIFTCSFVTKTLASYVK